MTEARDSQPGAGPTDPGASAALHAIHQFCDGLVTHTPRMLGDGPTARRLLTLAHELREGCERLAHRLDRSPPAIALVGETGGGKSWLARCFFLPTPANEPLLHELRSGQNRADRTERLTWFGPEAPSTLGHTAGERFVRVTPGQMVDLGQPYILGDTPGFSSRDAAATPLSDLAVKAAAVKVLVLTAESLRDGGLTRLISDMPGATVIPLIRFRPAARGVDQPDQALRHDAAEQARQWRQAAPETRVAEPAFFPDRDVFSDDPADAERRVREQLRDWLLPHLEPGRLGAGLEHELDARRRAAQRQVAVALAPWHESLGQRIEAIDHAAAQVPARVVAELLGDGPALRVALRQRFRASLIEATPAWCFPYRSCLGLLTLTAGAWDRLVLSMCGSLPSLALSLLQTARNLREAAGRSRSLRRGIAQRGEGLARDLMATPFAEFASALDAALARRQGDASRARPLDGACRVLGLDGLEALATHAMDKASASYGPGRWIKAVGPLATLVFAGLIVGPVASIYQEYSAVAWRLMSGVTPEATSGVTPGMMTGDGPSWRDFPTPPASLWITSLALSAAPVFVAALSALAWVGRGGRVRRATRALMDTYSDAAAERTARGELRIVAEDARVESARWLLRIGKDRPAGD